jgi:hypothetical protein
VAGHPSTLRRETTTSCRARWWLTTAGAIGLLLCPPSPAHAQSTHTIGAASFVPPAGWDETGSSSTRRVYTRIRDASLCMILVYADDPSSPDLDAALTRSWNSTFGQGFRSAPRPATRMQTSASGYRHALGEGDVVDNGGTRFVARVHVFAAGRGTQAITWIGNDAAALDGCRAEWDTLFSSLRFSDTATATAGASPNQPGPAPVAPAPAMQASSSSSPQRFDNVIFTPPPGWDVRQLAFGVELSPTNIVGQELLAVWILQGRASRAGLDSELATAWTEVERQLGAQSMRTVNGTAYDTTSGRSPRGWEFARGIGGMRRPGVDFTVHVYAIRAGDRIERVAVLARDIRETLIVTNATLSPRHSGPLRTLIFSLRFANLPDPKLPEATIHGSGITGVWAGLGMSVGRIKPEFAIFFTGGVAYFAPRFPSWGLADLDPSVEQPAEPREWGTWTMNGTTGEMVMPYERIPLRLTGTALELTTSQTPHRYQRLTLPASGRLDGTWCTDAAGCLRLTTDGRFEDTGAIRTVEHSSYAYPLSPLRGEGRYEIRDHTLFLRYDTGAEIRLAFPGLTDDQRAGSPQYIVLGFAFDILNRRQ